MLRDLGPIPSAVRRTPMNEVLAKGFLFPLLLTQGMYVRRVVPRLPEPEGERAGVRGQGRALRLLILGDSSAAGVGAPTQDEALSGHVTRHLAQHCQVSWKLVAASGATTQQALNLVEAEPRTEFDVAFVAIGGNDVTSNLHPRQWVGRLERLTDTLGEKFNVARVVYSALPPMHLFPALPQPLRWYIGSRARTFNRHLAEFTERHTRCALLDPKFTADISQMASDGFHPGPRVYAAWAEAAASMLLSSVDSWLAAE